MPTPSRTIARIRVEGLFGAYDYDLQPSAENSDVDRLWILYGNNGCGKTTILRTLFHLLAPETGEGHKTVVAGIPFGKFEVVFTSGERVWAKRSDAGASGTFDMGLKLKGKKELVQKFVANEEERVLRRSPEEDAPQDLFLRTLGELDLGLFFLSDDRTVRLAGQPAREPAQKSGPIVVSDEEYVLRSRHRMSVSPWLVDPEKLERRATALLFESIQRAEWWIKTQTVSRSSEGESNVNTLYAEILNRVSLLPLDETHEAVDAVAQVEALVGSLEKRSREFARYGLAPEFNGRDIIAAVKAAPSTHLRIMTNVVRPYIESVEKKLDAMERLQQQLDALFTTLNSFFTHKSISFEPRRGIRIVAESGRQLAPDMLSSGERHLLLLFLNTLLALDRPCVFIIDEPEISLNIKWQRRLLGSLLKCAGDSPIQYLFATHSFELLSQHKNNAIKVSEEVR